MQRARHILTVSVIAISTVSVIVATILNVQAIATIVGQRTLSTPPTAARMIQSGDRLTFIKDNILRQSPLTLLVVYSDTCPYCRASQPFYRRVGELARQSQHRWQFVVVASGDRDDISRHLVAAQIRASAVVIQDRVKLPVPGTPTLVLADAFGLVKRIWTGRLNPIQEQEVLDNVNAN